MGRNSRSPPGVVINDWTTTDCCLCWLLSTHYTGQVHGWVHHNTTPLSLSNKLDLMASQQPAGTACRSVLWSHQSPVKLLNLIGNSEFTYKARPRSSWNKTIELNFILLKRSELCRAPRDFLVIWFAFYWHLLFVKSFISNYSFRFENKKAIYLL